MNAASVGLFLDLDGVLTPKSVNLQFAAMRKIESELIALEDDFANGVIQNIGFNEKFIPLFRRAGFTEKFARDKFQEIQLNPSADVLISLCLPDIFIVSSSPSYYVEPFARRFNIPADNIICSRYSFSEDGELAECVSPCGIFEKASFVESRAKQYVVSIGVGDSLPNDSRFMNHCTLKVLMGCTHRTYLHASDLLAVLGLVQTTRSLAAQRDSASIPLECQNGVDEMLRQSTYDKNVFIMTPFKNDARYAAAIQTIKDQLQSCGLKGWTADSKNLSEDLWTNVRCFMHSCRYGVALITAHEEQLKKSVKIRTDVYNPNVMAEVGYMMALGKKVLLLKDSRMAAPTDWLGKLYTEFDFQDPAGQIQNAIKRWKFDGQH